MGIKNTFIEKITTRSLVLHVEADPRGVWQFTCLVELPYQSMLWIFLNLNTIFPNFQPSLKHTAT